MSTLSWENGASYTQAVSWLLKLFFNTKYTCENKAENQSDHKAFYISPSASPKQTEPGAKEEIHDGQARSWKTWRNRATAPQQSEPASDSCHAVLHIQGEWAQWRFLVQDKGNQASPDAASLWEPGSLQDLKLSSMFPISIATQ